MVFVHCDCCGDGLLKIKCPITLAGLDPNATTMTFVEEDASGYKVVKKTHQYYSQVVFQMGVTNRSWCDLVVFSPAGHLTIRVEQDHERWEDLKSAADYFFKEHIVRALYASNCTTTSICDPQPHVHGPPGRDIFIVQMSVDSKKAIRKPRKRAKQDLSATSLYVCRVCQNACKCIKDINDDNEYSVQCVKCMMWYHWGCVKYIESLRVLFFL